MPTSAEHYENLLANYYSWMNGEWETKVEENRHFFESLRLWPSKTGIALDLGAGSGFQSVPLARMGYKVVAIDLSDRLLSELEQYGSGLDIKVIRDDILNFPSHCPESIELCVCMGDTLTHLESKEAIAGLFQKVYLATAREGKFILSFRDLTIELEELERFIPVRTDDERIFTCFLEYEQEHVKVHDLVYTRNNNRWTLEKSFYRKARVSFEWVIRMLVKVGFRLKSTQIDGGLVIIVAVKE